MPKLKKGEYKCKKCNGKGTILAKDDPKTLIWLENQRVACPVCNGKGKLDWIENVIGVEKTRKVSW